MSNKVISAICLASMLALATCKGAVAPAYAATEEEIQRVVDEYVMVYTAENLCQIRFDPSVTDKVTSAALEHIVSKEALDNYANNETVKTILALPMFGMSKLDFCKWLYAELEKKYS